MADNQGTQERCCQICGRGEQETEILAAGVVRPVVTDLIRRSCPEWADEGFICLDDLNRFRNQYVLSLVETEKGELSDLEKEVLESITRHEILATHTDQEYETTLSFGQHLSDRIARFGGSWRFILIFCGSACSLGSNQHHRPVAQTLRPLSLHSSQPVPLLPCRPAGAHHHDEPEPPGGKRPA